MPPANTPGRKKRENQYFDVGVIGRRTGISLKDTGVRDEHGLEPTEGIFSSPEKATTGKRTARKSNGSAPEPTEVLTGRRLARDGKFALPIPVGRSPIKTNLGATPRRGSSIGARSPFRPQASQTPGRASSHPIVNRVLDFSITEVQSSVEKSPRRTGLNGIASRTEHLEDDGDSSPDGEVQVNGTYEDSPLPQIGDAEDTFPGSEMPEEEDDRSANLQLIEESSAAIAPVKRGRGRPRKSDLSTVSEPQNENTLGEPEEPAEQEEQAAPEEPEDAPVVPKRRGRPPRVSTGDENTESERPAKRARGMPEEAATAEAEAPKRGRKKLADKDANAKLAAARAAKRNTRVEAPSDSTRPSVPRGVATRLREETPMEDDGASRSKYGRISIKPLAYWKGERAVFNVKPGPSYGNIEQIIRADEITPVRKPHRYRPARRRGESAQPQAGRRRRNFDVFEEDEHAEEEESWEVEEGTISGPVRMWDSELGAAPAEDEKDQQLAFAAAKIEPRPTLDNPNFCFTKTLTMPFFGAGVIELPPGGYKGTKNSRRFQFLFFVHYGKVTVEVAGNRFAITKGGMWQVPRGNFYSITNESDHAAKIIFAQGCEVEPERDGEASMVTVAGNGD